MNDTIVITQERMMGWLCFNRFHKISEKTDLKDPKRNIYIFKDSEAIRECMSKYNSFKNKI